MPQLPVSDQAIHTILTSLTGFHDGWNATSTVPQIEARYPPADYKTPSSRLTTLGTDFLFRCGTRTTARALSARGIRTFLYQFDLHHATYLDPASDICERDAEVKCGVYHGSEVRHVWASGEDVTRADRMVTRAMGQYWTNFAKRGTPNEAGLQAWPAYNESTDLHLRIAETVEVGSGYAKSRCDFWDSLPRQVDYPTR